MIVDTLFRRARNAGAPASDPVLTMADPTGWGVNLVGGTPSPDSALKLSAVFRAVDGISNSVAKLPLYLMDGATRERVTDHPVLPLLTVRPYELLTAATFK